MDLDLFHSLLKKIKNRDTAFIHEFDVRNEVTDLFRNEPFIRSTDVRLPYIIIRSMLPKSFIRDFLQITDDMINIDFACMDYNSYLIDCDKFEEDTSKCDIIDIANEEMKRIDSTEIDNICKEVIGKTYTEEILESIGSGAWAKEQLDAYLRSLDDKDILDLRVSDKLLFIKTKENIIPLTLSHIMQIDEDFINEVPINGKYKFYVIDASKWAPCECALDTSYNPKSFVSILKTIGEEKTVDNERRASSLRDLVDDAFFENWNDGYKEVLVDVEIEDRVVAIAIDKYIEDAKNVIGKALLINPKLFIEVSSPIGTVLLIDTKRWVLDPEFGDEEWSL